MKLIKKMLCTILILSYSIFTFVIVKAEDESDTVITVPITVKEEYDQAYEFFQIMNQNRKAAGLPEYKLDAGLTEIAMERAAQLCMYFSHRSMVYEPSEYLALDALCIDTPICGKPYKTEDIADGTADAQSTYKAWYNSSGHRPALLSANYNYCGIGVVTYHNNIKWCLIVSESPCGNTINGFSGTKTNTRYIQAKAKYFIERSVAALDEWADQPFRFSDKEGGYEGYVIQQPGIFTFQNHTPELFSIDDMGKLTPKANGNGSLSIYYKDSIKICTVNVYAYHDEPETETEVPPLTLPTQTETPKQTENVKQTEIPNQTESVKQTETPKQTGSMKKTELPKQTETKKQLQKQTEAKKQSQKKNATTPKKKSSVRKKVFTIKTSNVTYNGKSKKPSIKVYDGKKRLPAKYYKVIKYQNNKNIGYGTVLVKGRGKYAQYSGSVKFKILPSKMKLSSVKQVKRRMYVKWVRNKCVNGYQIVYGTDKKFRNAKGKNVGANTKSVKLKVSKKKTYYVKIRSYKRVGKELWYSKWSNVKQITIKNL